MTNRFLIANADDFGQSAGINHGIIEAHERGIVTSASLMVRWPAATEAAAYARTHTSLSLGLHFDLGEWQFRNGGWSKLYEVIPEEDVNCVRAEIQRQIGIFRRLAGLEPTHLDSHQHVHRRPALAPVFLDIARELNVPLRSYDPRIRYYGGFYGQDDSGNGLPDLIAVEAFLKTVEELPGGFTELSCHPGYAGDLDSMYCSERALEIETLCDPRVRHALAANSIQLLSFTEAGLLFADEAPLAWGLVQ
jgi:chitin disaccharide deacetylase